MTRYLENLLGAVGLSVADRLEEAAGEGIGAGGQAPGALVLIGMAPRTTIKRLARRLRLSHAGCVRLVERLEQSGWVKREGSDDRREVLLSLTKRGEQRVEALQAARFARLSAAVSGLSTAEKAQLAPILQKLMAKLTSDPVDAWANCRMCDADTCRRNGCPVETWADAHGDARAPDAET